MRNAHEQDSPVIIEAAARCMRSIVETASLSHDVLDVIGRDALVHMRDSYHSKDLLRAYMLAAPSNDKNAGDSRASSAEVCRLECSRHHRPCAARHP